MAKKKKNTQAGWASTTDLMNKVTSRRENAYANGWMDRPSQPTVTGSTRTDASGNVTSRKATTKSASSSGWASTDDLLEKAKKTYGNKSTAKVIGSTGMKNGQYWTKSAADSKNKTIREKTAENTESKLISNQNLAREWVNAKKNSYNAGAAMKKATGVSELKDQQLDQNEKIKAQSKAAAESRNAAVSGLATKLRDKLFGTTNGNDTVGQFGSREEYETDALKARTYSPSIYNSYVKQGQELAGSSQKKAEKYLAGQSNLAGASDISRNTEQDYYRGEGVLTASPDIALHEMTDDEANNYYYILKRYGETDANKYKNYVLNDVNARIAQKAYQYNQVNHGDDVLGTAGKVRDIIGNTGTQFEAGLIAAGSALPNLKAYVGGTDGVTATPVSSYYASEMLENTENPVEKIAYELAQNTGYMAPAIAAGAVTQNAAVQDVLLGLQSASNSYAESIREGKSQDDARLYATFSGFDEYATNKLLDGAGLVGGGILTKAVKNSAVRKAASEAIERIGSPVLKKALSSALEVGADMGGEATQEFLQNFTDRLYRRIAFGEGAGEVDWKDPNTYINALKDPEAWHDAMIGALNAGLMQSGRIVSGAANTLSENAERKEMFRNPETYSQIAEGVDTSTPEGKRVQELAQAAAEQTEQGKTVSAMQQDEIYQALNEAVQTAADEEDIAANKQQVEENQEAAEAQAAMEEATAENAADQQEIQEETEAPAREETTAAEASEAVPYAVMADQEEAQKAQLKKLSADELSRRISENNRQFLESYTKNYDPEGQKAVLRNYTDGRDLVSYMSSASEVYNMARHGARQDQLGARRILLSDAETEDIWKAGWRDREASIERVLNTSYKERQEKRTGGLMSAVPETSESMKKVLDTLGKKTGIAFVVTDSGKYGELGSFNAESGVVTVDLQSDNPLGTVSHEMTHWVKAYNPAGYQLFEDAAMQSLARSEHFSLDAEMDKYKRAYPDLTNDEIREEIVANSTETFLNDEQFIRDICSGKNKSIGKRIVEWLTDVIDAFKEMISDRSFSRVADVLRQDVKSYERTRQLWMDGIDEAAENMETKQYVGESKLKNQAMLHPEVVNQKHMEDNIQTVRKMEPIFTVTENKVKDIRNAKELLKTASKFYEEHGRRAYNEDTGAVELNDSALTDVIGHRWYPKKMAVLLNLKEMIENGKLVNYETNHQSRTSRNKKHFDTAMLASKITLKVPGVDEGDYYAIVTLNVNTENNKAYAHDVDFEKIENGASVPFSTERDSIPSLVGNGSAPGTLAPSTKTIFEILRGDNTPNDDFLESNDTAESPKMELNGPDEIKVDGTKFQRKIKDELDGIRFQLRLDDEDAFSGTMEEQNEKLKRANAYLTTMLQTSKDLTPSSKDISRTASEMLKEYNSKFDKKKLTDQLTKLYTYIRTSENIDGAEVTSVAEAIAKQVVDTAVAVDPEEEATWKRLRQEMRKTSIYISPDDISDLSPEGYGALRKKWFGKINLTTKEESRENTGSSEYRQLKESFPEVFTADPDSFFNEADAVQAIFDAYEQARPRERSVFGTVATAQEAAADLSNKIIDGYFSVGNENIKTQYQKTYKQMRQGIREEVLNDYNKELNKIVIRDREKLSELKKAYAANEIAPETYLVQKDALNDYARQQREAADARFREKRDKNIEYGYRATYKRNIMKDSQSLLKMIESPSDKSHVPEAMVEPMLNILSHIDFSSNRVNYEGNPTQRSLKAQEFKNSVSSLMDTVRQIEKNDGMLETESSTVQMTIDPDLMENLRRIQNLFAENEELSDNIDNLSTQNMREVWESLRALKRMVESANKFFATQNNTTVEEAATRTISELGKRKADTRWTGGAGALKKLMTTGMMDSYTYMHELGTSGAEMYQEARDGLDKKIRKIKRSVDFMSDLKEKHHLDDKTLREWSEKPIKVKLSCLEGDSFGAVMSEKEVEIKPTQIMSLYLLNQRNQARQHLYGDKYSNNRQNGGFQLDEIKREGIKGALGMVTKDNTVYKVSEGTVDRLTSMLTPEQKAVAMEIGRFLTDETSAWGNEVTMQLYGYKKFQAKNYFPIRVADDTITKTSQQIEQGMTMLKNMGMTKSVQKKAYNPLILEDIFDVFVRQADEMSSYNAYVPVIADIQKWYNYKGEMGNVQRSIERVMGKDGSTYMMNLLRDLNGGRDSDEWNVLYGMAGKYKGAAVGANLRTAIQQPTAYARAMAVMDPKYLLQGLTLNPRESAKQYELCQEYAPIALWKEWGSYDINVGRSMNQILMGTSSKLDQVREASMWLAGKGDEVAWVRLWYSAQKQVEDQTDLKPGTKEFYEESAKVFNHVIDTTQVVDSVLHRSDMMKDKSVYAKSLTSFMAEPTKTYNMLYRAWASLERGEKGAKKNAARIAAVYVITAVLTTAAASVVSALRDDDKDKTFGEKYIEKVQSDLLDNLLPWNNIPFVKDLISVASGDDATDLNTEGLSNLFEAIEEAEKAVKGESKYGPLGLLYKASDAGSLIGLALRNGMKDMGGLIDTFVIGNNSEMQYWRDKLMYNMQAQNSSGEYSNAKYFLASAMRAYAQGDTEVGDRITKELKEIMGEEKISNMMKNQLQKEPEVEELGEAMLNNDTKKIEKLKKSLLDKGYSEDQIEAKAESELNKLAPISTGDLAAALYDKTDGYQDSLNAYIEYQKKLGKTDKDIQSKIRSALTSKYKQEYIDNPGKRSEMAKKLYSITVNRKQLYTSKDLQSWLK